jgi:hypothetical protein
VWDILLRLCGPCCCPGFNRAPKAAGHNEPMVSLIDVRGNDRDSAFYFPIFPNNRSNRRSDFFNLKKILSSTCRTCTNTGCCIWSATICKAGSKENDIVSRVDDANAGMQLEPTRLLYTMSAMQAIRAHVIIQCASMLSWTMEYLVAFSISSADYCTHGTCSMTLYNHTDQIICKAHIQTTRVRLPTIV